MGGSPGLFRGNRSELNFERVVREKLFLVQFILPKLLSYMGRMHSEEFFWVLKL
jgi:hypothetical protein